jgi:hypothetical protein
MIKTIKDILEEYKGKIAGYEFDFRSQHSTLEEYEEFLRIAQYQAETEIVKIYKDKIPSEEELYKIIQLNSGEASPSSPWGWRRFIAKAVHQEIINVIEKK